MKRLLLLLLVFVMLCFTITACDKECSHDYNRKGVCEKCGHVKTPVYTVTFNTDGGSKVSSQKVKDGNKVREPDDPTKDGYEFAGWYYGDEKWSFVGYVVTDDMTLTAKWIPITGGETGNQSNYPWDETRIIISINEDSYNSILPTTSRRYLAGELNAYEVTDYSKVDDYVKDRNTAAKAYTNVNAEYQYLPDAGNYGWGTNIHTIYRQATGGDVYAPDVYVDFVYDMVAASLKGAFANLYSTTMYGTYHEWSSPEYNYFQFEDNRVYVDTGKDYMYDYMKSLTLSKYKMYCLASDYLIDTVRASLVIPVNIEMLENIPMAAAVAKGEPLKANSDRNGDNRFDIDDLYRLVWDREWNYEALAELSALVTQELGGEGIGIEDQVGFALDTSGSNNASLGMLYSTSLTIIQREFNGADYTHYYPYIKETVSGDFVFDGASDDPTFDQLNMFCNNLADLVASKGVITVGGYTSSNVIRSKFVNNTLLFGGVVALGELEHDDYISMKGEGKKGYGIVPIPIYHSEGGDEYSTTITNIGKIAAISVGTKNFAQCTAFLDYQSMNSNKVLNEYYNHKLRQTVQVKGTYENAEMLTFIRSNVGSAFDMTFDDALGAHYNAQADGKSDASKWHVMIKNNNFSIRDMRTLYGTYAGQKATWIRDLEFEYNRLPS